MPKRAQKAGSATPTPAREIRREKAPQHFSIYANDIQVQTSPWDVRFLFGQVAGPAPNNTDDAPIVVQQQAELHISPQLAKKLMQILTAQIAVYERELGPIPSPTDR